MIVDSDATVRVTNTFDPLSAASRLLLPRTGSDFLARVLVFASVLIAVVLALAASTAVHNRRRALS